MNGIRAWAWSAVRYSMAVAASIRSRYQFAPMIGLFLIKSVVFNSKLCRLPFTEDQPSQIFNVILIE